MKQQITLTVNGRQVKGSPGDSVLDVCRSNDIHVPTLCHLEGLTPTGGCRMCLVEIEKERKPVPSCTYPAREGLVVQTHTDQLERYRRLTLELLFTERSHFCMYCEKSGDCELQKLAYAYRMDHVRFDHRFPSLALDALSDTIVIDHNRCVLCGRCVRECREMSGNRTLDFAGRGWRTRVAADLGLPLGLSTCTTCGACVQACPTGAIFAKQGIYRGPSSQCERARAVCPGCGVGCELDVLVKDNNLVRIEAADPHGLRGTLCREGRFELLRENEPRVAAPLMRNEEGRLEPCSLDRALDVIAERALLDPSSFAGVVSSKMPLETLSLFERFIHKTLCSDWMDTMDGPFYRSIVAGIERFGDARRGLDIECGLEEMAAADCILVAGCDPELTHPVVGSLVKRSKCREGTTLMVIDPSVNPFPLWTDLWLRPKSGTEAVLIRGMARAHLFGGLHTLWDDGPDPMEESSRSEKREVLDITGIQEAELAEAVRIYGSARRAVVVHGEGLIETGGPAAVASLLKLAAVTGNRTGDKLRVLSLKPAANSRGAWQAGLAARSLDWDRVKGVYLLLGDDRIGGDLPTGLRKAPFVAVQATFHSLATDLAHVVLPAPMWAERAGRYMSMDGKVSESMHVLERAPGAVSVRETLQALSARIVRAGFTGEEGNRVKGQDR